MNKGTFRGPTRKRAVASGETYPVLVPVNFDGTSLTLTAGYVDRLIRCRSGSAVTITVSAMNVARGAAIHIKQYGAGQVTLVEGAGVTLLSGAGKKTRAAGSIISIILGDPASSVTGKQEWDLCGDSTV